MGIWYATREDVQQALDAASTTRDAAQIDREIEASSRGIESLCHRTFYPLLATRYFDWPNDQMGRSWRLWLDQYELAQLDTITSGGAPVAEYFLEPANAGPPFDRVEIDLASQSSFNTGNTHQRNIVMTGLWAGAPVEERAVGALSGDLAANVAATASATFTTARIGVGDVLRIDAERMVVTAKTMADSTQDTQADLASNNAATVVAVTNGAAFAVGVVLLIGAERMLVTDVAGNNLIVKRAWDGTVLAAHTTGTSIFTLTGVEFDRAQLGTALAAHTTGAVIQQWKVPALVRQLVIAETLNTFEQERSAYARTVGSGESERNASGAGIADIRKNCYRTHGRKARLAAV